MEENISSIINNENINGEIQNIKEKLKKLETIRKIEKLNVIKKYSEVVNFLLFFEIIFILLPKAIFSKNFMEIKVNQIGYNQIISDYYNDTLPSIVLINNLPILMRNKKVYAKSMDDLIYLEWPDDKTEINVINMFNNLDNIISVNMNIFGENGNMSYMFYNCKNLVQFNYSLNYNKSYGIRDMSSIFYNCYSLRFFNFAKFYLDKNANNNYYNISLSYMFYNCKSLESIDFGNKNYKKIIDMKEMFYNCFSLKSIVLTKVDIINDIDFSYMFYNCSNLKSFTSNIIYIKEMKYMFYNCSLLNNINLENFRINPDNNYINMSNVFYNCYSLKSLQGDFSCLNINDAREMFYNCSSLLSLNFYPKGVNNSINMTKMFYNCTNLTTVVLNKNNFYIFPIDLSFTFYNCISLTSVKFNYFQTDYLEEISYMMFNCSSLQSFLLVNSNFSNLLIKNMRGVFQNCSSLTSLDLTNFYTPQVEIMWDMFKGCSSLQQLIFPNFNTINVLDMESMFEGCLSFKSLNLTHFKTTKVRYMNKMFSGCKQLENLDIRYIKSDALGTMYQMFYNCQSLNYLNIYSLVEIEQSIIEMFEGASNNFKFCIQENERIPEIFKQLLLLSNTIRDCSENCYGSGNIRISIPEKKLCCPNFEFNKTCYDICPPRTKRSSIAQNKNCIYFTCDNYYNFNQTDCIDEVPEGYYVNDTGLKTIDKCPSNCRTCEKNTTQNRIYCLTCNDNDNLTFLYFGECLNSCVKGFYNNSGILTCKCATDECKECSEESLQNDLCISCDEGYYPKSDEYDGIHINNTYKKCYKNPPKYYLDQEEEVYKKCYSSCQSCTVGGNKTFHNCLSCDPNYNFAVDFEDDISKNVTKNCYRECKYNYYFNDENDYQCSATKNCPSPYIFLIVELGQCVKTCNNTIYIKKLKNDCYKECPKDISKESEERENYCDIICPYDSPFKLVIEEICVSSCTIMQRKEKLCVTDYIGNRTNLQIQEIIHDDIISDLTHKFNYSMITDNNSIIVEENHTFYEIISSRNKNKNNKTSFIDFGECETLLREYYEINETESIYILKMDTYIEGKTGPTVVYELFYPLENSNYLVQLDISICEGEKINILYEYELDKPELYDKNNPIYSDICYPYTSVDGADMTLSGKQKEYTNNNKSLCEENCEFIGYDRISHIIDCSCDIKDSSTMISDIKIDKSKLYSFININKIANFDVLKCVNLIIKKEYLISNIGFYTFIPSFISYFIAVIIFLYKDFATVKKEINNFVKAKKNLEYLKEKRKKLIEKELIKQKEDVKEKHQLLLDLPGIFAVLRKIKKSKNKMLERNIKKMNQKNINTTELKLHGTSEEKITGDNILLNSSQSRLRRSNNIININNIHNDIIIIKKKPKNAPPPKAPNNINNKIKKNNINIYPKKANNFLSEKKDYKNISQDFNANMAKIGKEENKMRLVLKKNDKELNEMNFKSAVRFDNRTFWVYYCSLLKDDHLLLRVMNSTDYNSKAIKIYLFIYNFGLSYAVNGLFFDDEAIEKIFEEKGKFNFINQLPLIIYSTIISLALFSILDYLALTGDSVLEVKKRKVAKIAEKKANETLKISQIKFIFFFILSFFFMLACWYYMTCFCAVYRNTQYHLLKDTLIGFGTSMLSPLAAKLAPAFFRIYAIKKRSQIFFRISQFIQIFL